MLNKFAEVNQKIEETVVSGYKKIEDSVVGGYKKIEEGAVEGFQKISDKFIDNFLILVVEDDVKLNHIVCTYLNDNGFAAKGCLNANEAYNEMYNSMYQLIISDIMMPEIDGFEFLGKSETKKELRLKKEEIADLFMMTPYYYRTRAEDKRKILSREQMTVEAEFQILVYKKK